MAYNGSGTFLVNSAGQPVVTGTVISSTAFNALTADLATGLSTAITNDGQTTTTVRVPFAQGISSTLVTDATSATTGSIITAGGISTQKALVVGTTATIIGALTPSQTAGIVGTTTNNNANAGSIGEYVSSLVAASATTGLPSDTPTNVTSISLTAGDWDVSGTFGVNPAASTVFTYTTGWISSTSATSPGLPGNGSKTLFYGNTAGTPLYPTNTIRFSLSGTTTIYLTLQAGVTVSTAGVFGFIGARRVR